LCWEQLSEYIRTGNIRRCESERFLVNTSIVMIFSPN
jgi:hypothetical protein